MNYLIIILLVVLVGFVEFLIIRKGMKAGKKTSSYIRGGPESPSPSSPRNKYVHRKGQQQGFFSKQNTSVESLEEGGNVRSFVPTLQDTGESSDINREIRQKETPVREQSMLEIIQEIRGESPHAEQNFHEPFQEQSKTDMHSEEIDFSETENELTSSSDFVPNEDINEVDKENNAVSAEEGETMSADDFDSALITSKPELIDEAGPELIDEAGEMVSPEELLKSGLELIRQ